MNRLLKLACVTALLVQNFVFCCGHVHVDDQNSNESRRHVHLHGHDHVHHGHDHHHHHHGDESDDSQPIEEDNSHDCVIASTRMDAIIQNVTEIQSLADCFSYVRDLYPQLETSSRSFGQAAWRCHHQFWYQTSAIHLQICALLN